MIETNLVCCGRRVDFHQHYFPSAWKELLAAWANRTGIGQMQVAASARWSLEQSLADMDRFGIAVAMLSLPNPGTETGEPLRETVRAVARGCNEEGARIVEAHPDRFGFFATLPTADTEASLAEIKYAFDSLGADGVCLYTSSDGAWLGDPQTLPILVELDRRGALVLVHPNTPNCCVGLAGLRPGLLELPFDTTRCIVSLWSRGAFARFSSIRFIFCHAGGAIPMLSGRVENLLGPSCDESKITMFSDMAQVYFDVALTTELRALTALKSFAGPERILFGTDYPFGCREDHIRCLQDGAFSLEEIFAIERGNAEVLLPRLAVR